VFDPVLLPWIQKNVRTFYKPKLETWELSHKTSSKKPLFPKEYSPYSFDPFRYPACAGKKWPFTV